MKTPSPDVLDDAKGLVKEALILWDEQGHPPSHIGQVPNIPCFTLRGEGFKVTFVVDAWQNPHVVNYERYNDTKS